MGSRASANVARNTCANFHITLFFVQSEGMPLTEYHTEHGARAMTKSTSSNSKFRKGSAVYTCSSCGKRTRETGGSESFIGLCAACQDEAGLENEHQDGMHDVPMAGCPMCAHEVVVAEPVAEAKPARKAAKRVKVQPPVAKVSWPRAQVEFEGKCEERTIYSTRRDARGTFRGHAVVGGVERAVAQFDGMLGFWVVTGLKAKRGR